MIGVGLGQDMTSSAHFFSSPSEDDLSKMACGEGEEGGFLARLPHHHLPRLTACQPPPQKDRAWQAAWPWVEWAEEGDGPVLPSCRTWSSGW